MNAKKKNLIGISLITGFLLIGLIVIGGCKKSEPQTSQPPAGETEEVAAAAETETEEVTEVAAATIEQTICPVMEGPINKELYTEYKGQKVYFCCAGCKEKFEQEPEKYIAKLPQFNQ